MLLKIISASVAFAAICLRVVGKALVKNLSTMKTGRVFESYEKRDRRARWAKRGIVFVKVNTVLLLVVAAWAVIRAFLRN